MTGWPRRSVAGALAARAVLSALRAAPVTADRQNYRGRTVSLLAGPALAVAIAATEKPPRGALPVLGAGLLGAYDDAVGDRDAAKGLRGHVGALASGRLTTGGVKLAGLPAVALLARRRGTGAADAVLDAGVVAGTANLVNLLDLRPGRALKVGLLGAVALAEPGVAGACVALLPGDLAERTMLGDAGSNALGAALGAALVARARGRAARAVALATLVGLTVASERVSFSALIDRNPLLRRLDQLGRVA